MKRLFFFRLPNDNIICGKSKALQKIVPKAFSRYLVRSVPIKIRCETGVSFFEGSFSGSDGSQKGTTYLGVNYFQRPNGSQYTVLAQNARG